MAGTMHNSNMEEMDCGSFFDQIDDLLDFPVNDEDLEAGLPGKIDSFPSIWSTESDSIFSNTKSDLSAQLSVPYEDIVELDWLSNFVDDSFCGGGAVNYAIGQESSSLNKEDPFITQSCTTSPVSVLDSSSSSSSPSPPYGKKPAPAPNGLIPVNGGRKGKARSKRPRPATFNPRPSMQIISPTASSVSPQALSDSENYAESQPASIKIPKQKMKKKKMMIKPTIVQGSDEAGDGTPSGQPVRKCLHCEITKTPQWRAGPMGPKTLCNACGVRHKSGRLFPEYRPAASPTFIPSVHSNSHKKVLEMRSKIGSESTADDTPAELIPNPAIRSDGI